MVGKRTDLLCSRLKLNVMIAVGAIVGCCDGARQAKPRMALVTG
jgi:hypothetical protein